MGKTAYFTDDLFLEHNTGDRHPENYRRLVAIREALERQDFFGRLLPLSRRVATAEEIALNHDPQYVDQVADFCRTRGGLLDADTVVSTKSHDAAALSVGAGLEAADRILAGEVDRALLLLRPPGHHSLRTRAMGFCLFNNIAITARYLQSRGLDRIAILDWDVHHGNGTEASFYSDPEVLFISTHQYPFYPGTGAATDRGEGAGLGTTLNIPMAGGSDDADYRSAFENQVFPALQEFRPSVLLISAGFDAHRRDPLASINLTTEFFEWATARVLEIAREHSAGRVISFLEGGYDLSALAECVSAHAAALSA